MLANESSSNHSHLSVSENQGRLVFARMNRYIGRLSKHLTAENVHHFRTNSRRVEALIATLAPETRNKKKALKLVAKLRKRAGKVRDTDVQISLLKGLKVPDRQNHRAQLLELLDEEHERLTKASPKHLEIATQRYKLLGRALPEGDGAAVAPRTLQRWQAQFRTAEVVHGHGFTGLIPRWSNRNGLSAAA